MQRNIFADPVGGLAQGYDFVNGVVGDQLSKRAAYRAAPKVAAGDYAGAAADYGAMGQTNEAYKLRGAQEQADQAAYERQRQGEQDARAQEAQQKKERLTVLETVTQNLGGVPPGQRRAALEGGLALFQRVGIDVTPFASLREEDLTDDNLRAFGAELQKAKEQFTLTPGAKRFDEHGKLIAEAPFAPSYQKVGEGDTLVQVGGDSGTPSPSNWAEGVAAAAPDAQVTSGYRSPAHNAEVGGVPNSRHLSGQAVDLVPRPGETMAQLYARVQGVPGTKAINEGDHVHVQAAGPATASGGARVIAQGPPKPREQWVDLPGGGQRNTATGETKGVPNSSGRVPATVIKMQTDLLTDLQGASAVNSVIDRTINQIDAGQLDLGPVKNIFAEGRNVVGMSDANSRNFATFRASLEKMRNDSLRLNKGVQTEGDAIRAWNELIKNVGDERLVRQRLVEIKDLNEQAIALRKDLVNQARQDSGMPPIDTSRFEARPTANDPGRQSGAPRVRRYNPATGRLE